MYEVPGRPPKGRWAAFLHRQRRERNWSQTKAFEELREGLGLGPKSRASYVRMDMGPGEPSPKQQAFLVSYFGEEPSPADTAAVTTEEVGPSDIAQLAAAIRLQAAAIDRLADGIIDAAGSAEGSMQGFGAVLGLVAGKLGIELPRTPDELAALLARPESTRIHADQ